jgi:hypothetical protein
LLTYGRALGTGQGLVSPKTQVERLTSFPSPAGYGLAIGVSMDGSGTAVNCPGITRPSSTTPPLTPQLSCKQTATSPPATVQCPQRSTTTPGTCLALLQRHGFSWPSQPPSGTHSLRQQCSRNRHVPRLDRSAGASSIGHRQAWWAAYVTAPC